MILGLLGVSIDPPYPFTVREVAAVFWLIKADPVILRVVPSKVRSSSAFKVLSPTAVVILLLASFAIVGEVPLVPEVPDEPEEPSSP